METTIDLAPGRLTAFMKQGEWECSEQIGINSASHIGTLISLIWRQHRVMHYHVGPSREHTDRRAYAIMEALHRYPKRPGSLASGTSFSLLHPWLPAEFPRTA